MKRNLWKKLGALAAAGMLLGCTDRKHYEDAEKAALRYYKEKYNLEEITIVNSIRAGNSGLFGYVHVRNRAYEMSDGNTVYWNDSLQKLSDTRQAEEITAAFQKEIMDPLFARFSFPKKISSYSLNRTQYDSYDECVFNTYYDGDINAFLKEEKPVVNDLVIVLETKEQEKCEAEITAFFEALNEKVTGFGNAYVLKSGIDDVVNEKMYVDTYAFNVTADARMDFGKKISWYRQKYIEVTDGVYAASFKRDFTLEEGDIRFEQAGTCADLQKMLDESYEAMPVDAEENAKGGYLVKDRRHENRIVLDDISQPLYRAVFSDRVKKELDSRQTISVSFMDTKGNRPLMVYYGPERKASIYVFSIFRDDRNRGSSHSLSESQYFYFGTHHSVPYEENDAEEKNN